MRFVQRSRFNHWTGEKMPVLLQDVICFPGDLVYSVYVYIKNRFVDRTHLLSTKLPVGNYYDPDARLLYGCFELLVDFVEGELASHTFENDTLARELYRNQPYSLGTRALENMVKEGHPEQAELAQKTLDLYNWWKFERPARDGYDLDQNWYKQDTEMLVKLVEIRRFLWY